MAKMIVRASAVCGALPLGGAEVYINDSLCGTTDESGYSDIFDVNGSECRVSVKAAGYEECFSPKIKLYENVTVVWSAMLEGQRSNKVKKI